MMQLRRNRRSLFSITDAGAPPIALDGVLLYAIGDIHGRNDLLLELMGMIRADIAAQGAAKRATLVFLGDYIDRGSASNKVIDTIIDLQADPNLEVIALRGNHDQFMLDFLRDGLKGPMWVNFGGAQTLIAYGVTPPRGRDEQKWTEAAMALAEAMPDTHRVFLESLPYFAVAGDYVFVHAGVRPNTELRNQRASDVLAIRESFLEADQPLPGCTVVFGHTPFESPLVEPGKIGLDTGACVTGVLTAICLENTRRRFLQTGPRGGIFDAPNPADGPTPRPRRL
jgi:serine/threonine protein phosphatase 1